MSEDTETFFTSSLKEDAGEDQRGIGVVDQEVHDPGPERRKSCYEARHASVASSGKEQLNSFIREWRHFDLRTIEGTTA
ncbi:MAG: hypothetical protein HRT88_15485, partial [Lentisphaeraceae bacterium]|nr:hypothetical protein [Lentisphaeraceae bacterium]